MTNPTEQRQTEAIAAARAEILKPSLATTVQILAVHQVEMFDGVPEMVWTNSARAEDALLRMHFSLVGQPYMFGVSITNTGPVRVAGSYLEASCSVSLVIKSDLLSPDEISSRVGLEPSHTQKKDVPNRPGASAPTNSWVLKGKHEHGPADVVIPEFIEMLESAGQGLLAIAALAHTDLYVAVTYHGNVDWMWGIHLEASTLRRLTALGAAFDLDLYASGPALPSEAIQPVD